MARYCLFFLVEGYIKDNRKGSMINFQDFHLQRSIRAFPFLLFYSNCPVFTPDDYILFLLLTLGIGLQMGQPSGLQN